MRPLIMVFAYVEPCVILICILNICEADFQSSLPQRVQLLGSAPGVCKKVQMEPIVGPGILLR